MPNCRPFYRFPRGFPKAKQKGVPTKQATTQLDASSRAFSEAETEDQPAEREDQPAVPYSYPEKCTDHQCSLMYQAEGAEDAIQDSQVGVSGI